MAKSVNPLFVLVSTIIPCEPGLPDHINKSTQGREPFPGELRTPVSAYLNLKEEECRLFPDVGRFFRKDPLAVYTVSLAALISLAGTPMAGAVEEIEVPVMIIHSELDDIFPEDYVRRVYGRLGCDKEFLYLPGRHHLVMLDYVDEIISPVSAWLKKQMSGRDDEGGVDR